MRRSSITVNTVTTAGSLAFTSAAKDIGAVFPPGKITLGVAAGSPGVAPADTTGVAVAVTPGVGSPVDGGGGRFQQPPTRSNPARTPAQGRRDARAFTRRSG
jgi:hypothetical protein